MPAARPTTFCCRFLRQPQFQEGPLHSRNVWGTAECVDKHVQCIPIRARKYHAVWYSTYEILDMTGADPDNGLHCFP